MPENAPTREMVESAVRAVFEAQAARFQEDVTRLVWERLNVARPGSAAGNGIELLEQATSSIERTGSQSDVLQALLEGTVPFGSRAAVFLLRATSAVAWQARGFRDNEAIRLLTVEASSGLMQQVLVQRAAVCADAEQFDARFLAEAGRPSDGRCVLIPLSVRDKVVALLYADAGVESGGVLETPALQLLVRFAGIWLELLALRKSTGIGVPVATPSPESPTVPQEVPAAPVALQQIPEPSTPLGNESGAQAFATSLAAAAAATPQVASASASDDEELHRKARRFAKLLVEEIKLYNLPKVRDGKLHRNLYDRLKDDIEKSRATYDQRYAKTPIASAEYFTQELVRGLADGDATLFGSNFPR